MTLKIDVTQSHLNSQNVLQRYLPDRPDPHYSLRERLHNKSLHN